MITGSRRCFSGLADQKTPLRNPRISASRIKQLGVKGNLESFGVLEVKAGRTSIMTCGFRLYRKRQEQLTKPRRSWGMQFNVASMPGQCRRRTR